MIPIMARKYLTCLLLCSSVWFAAAQDSVFVRLKGGQVRAYSLESIDSLSFMHPPIIAENTVKDIDNHEYQTVSIGNQVWMAENLLTTHFRNGDLIPTTTSDSVNISREDEATFQWAFKVGDAGRFTRYYTWFAVTDNRKLAPEGWHIATYADWNTLINFVVTNGFFLNGIRIGNDMAKWLADPTGWAVSDVPGTPGYLMSTNNESGFNAFPSGYRTEKGLFEKWNTLASWWLETPYDTNNVYLTELSGDYTELQMRSDLARTAMPVRCVKDVEATDLPSVSTDCFSLGSFSIRVTGDVLSNGGGTLFERGYCWDTQANPTVASNRKTIRGSVTGEFIDTLKNLTCKTDYYIRAYAINSQGVSYGNEVAVTTPDTIEDWKDYAIGTFNSVFFSESWSRTLQYSALNQQYRFKDLYTVGYNLLFEWDGGSAVNVLGTSFKGYSPAVETGYIDSSYGMVWGIFNGDNTYDSSSSTFSFPITWRVTAGSYGKYTDTFTINSWMQY
jgi:uncharacterized protein (TIGR02145 family)